MGTNHTHLQALGQIRANARNVRLYYPYWQHTNFFIFRFVFLLCLRSTLSSELLEDEINLIQLIFSEI